jgi:hypothetical protein
MLRVRRPLVEQRTTGTMPADVGEGQIGDTRTSCSYRVSCFSMWLRSDVPVIDICGVDIYRRSHEKLSFRQQSRKERHTRLSHQHTFHLGPKTYPGRSHTPNLHPLETNSKQPINHRQSTLLGNDPVQTRNDILQEIISLCFPLCPFFSFYFGQNRCVGDRRWGCSSDDIELGVCRSKERQ